MINERCFCDSESFGYPADTFFIARVTVISAAGQAREIENTPDRAGDRDPGRRTGAGDFFGGA